MLMCFQKLILLSVNVQVQMYFLRLSLPSTLQMALVDIKFTLNYRLKLLSFFAFSVKLLVLVCSQTALFLP